jgi:4-diphosphocytidyl-2-C-methyl-D-erythritol kinase
MPLPAPNRVVRVRVPAKVNLHLAVGSVRPDGYHEIVTVYQAVDLYDEITATPAEVLQIVVTGECADQVPTGTSNLAWQAAVLLAQHVRVPPQVRLEIEKSIPVAGGMAGGSADAAGALLACATLWDSGSSRAELTRLAADIGSDVAFPLHGGTALATGRGELISPALTAGCCHWVFAFADFGLSAGGVYAELDRLREAGQAPPPIGGTAALLDAARSSDARRMAEHLGNDLEAAALVLAPSLRRTLAAGRNLGALAGIVSGSGPTCAFLCADADAATALAASLIAEDVCRTTRVATGPVPGARVVA